VKIAERSSQLGEFSTAGLIDKKELYRNAKDLENLMINYKQIKKEEELIKNNNIIIMTIIISILLLLLSVLTAFWWFYNKKASKTCQEGG